MKNGAPGGGWLYQRLEPGLGEAPEVAAVFGIHITPKSPFFSMEKGRKTHQPGQLEEFRLFPRPAVSSSACRGASKA